MLRIMIFYFNVLYFQGSLIGLHKSTKDAGDSEMWRISHGSLQVITRQRTFAEGLADIGRDPSLGH